MIVVLKDREACERAVSYFEKELGTVTGGDVTLVEFWHLAQFPIEVIVSHGEFLFDHKKHGPVKGV